MTNVIRTHRAGLLYGVALASMACIHAQAFAQEAGHGAGVASAAGDGDAGLGEIVVTAQFRGQNLQDTPLAITAVTGQMLDQKGQSNIVDLTATAPNVTLKPAGSTFGPALAASIRGVGQVDSSLALEPGVGVYIDDVYISTLFGSMVDLLDLDRVEILRGPQGTLTGQNSIGGAIKLFSRKPDGEGGGYVELTKGSFDRLKGRAAAEFAIVPDKLFARVSLAGESSDGYVKVLDYNCVNPTAGAGSVTNRKDCVAGREGGREYLAGRVAVRWLPSDRVEVNLSADWIRDRSEPTPSVISALQPAVAEAPGLLALLGASSGLVKYAPPGFYTSYANYTTDSAYGPSYSVQPKSWLDSRAVAGTVDIELSDNLSLKSISSYRYMRTRFNADADGSPFGLSTPTIDLTVKQYTQELRLNGSVSDGLFEYTLGGFYLKTDGFTFGSSNLVFPVGADPDGNLMFGRNEFLTENPTDSRSAALFGTVIVRPTDRLTLTGGLRYTNFKKTQAYNQHLPDYSAPTLVGTTAPFKEDKVDYRIAIQYEWTPAVMTYIQTATGFKGGGVNPRPLDPGQAQPFGSETLTAYEAGFKTRLFGNVARLNGALFYNKYKDIQLVRTTCDEFSPFPGFPCILPANAGNADVKGAELELEARPADGLLIGGSLAYLDFDYTALRFSTGIQRGFVTPFTSKWQASGGIQYDIDIGDPGTITPRIDLVYQSSFFTDAVNSPLNRVPGNLTANASLTFRSADDNWKAMLVVSNLFDKKYYFNKFDALMNYYGAAISQPAPPRQWALTLSRKF